MNELINKPTFNKLLSLDTSFVLREQKVLLIEYSITEVMIIVNRAFWY